MMTIKDIARLSKSSVTTVSRVINNENVRPETKERIRKVIQQYEYRPNTYAQYLGQRNRARFAFKSGSVSDKT